jgi:23S rRNA pseudouridine1911/1915/1917 synthase
MEHMEFKVSLEESGARIDKFIAVKLGEGYSRTLVKDLIDKGMVTVDGEKVKPRYAIKEEDEIKVDIPPSEPHQLNPENIPLKILYEDDWVIVLDKPSGIVVHPGSGNKSGTIVNALLHHCGKLPESDDRVRPGIVHRLDKDTSGVMVVAKNDRAMRFLSKQFEERAVKKTYLSVVRGNVEIDNGVIEAPVARQTSDRKKMTVEYTEGKTARTVYHVVERYGRFTLLRLDLHTGRTHQIRVHMKHLGNPVAGDPTYGGGQDMERQALHAEKLGFTHPDTGKYVEFISPMPDDMKRFIDKIKREK